METLTEQISRAINECGLRLTYIARAVQVSRGTVGKYKDGKIGANIERLQRIMTVAGYRLVLEKIPPKEDIFRKDRRLPPPAMD